MRIIKIFFLSFIGLCLFFMGLIYYTYFIAPDPREKIDWNNLQFENTHKLITYENKLDSIEIGLSIYFNYSTNNIQDSLYINRIDKDSYFLDKDSLYLEVSKYSGAYSILPIFKNDSIPFPKSFNIKIYDGRRKFNHTILKYLDYNLFKKYAVPKNMSNDNQFLTANEWILTIDSTLLGLKDSIR